MCRLNFLWNEISHEYCFRKSKRQVKRKKKETSAVSIKHLTCEIDSLKSIQLLNSTVLGNT